MVRRRSDHRGNEHRLSRVKPALTTFRRRCNLCIVLTRPMAAGTPAGGGLTAAARPVYPVFKERDAFRRGLCQPVLLSCSLPHIKGVPMAETPAISDRNLEATTNISL